jgi:acetyl-CoA carboxylase carboxyl transferase subunit alpha
MAEIPVERDFEKPILELEKRIEELESFSRKAGVDLSEEIGKLRLRANEQKREVFAKLSAWQRVLLSRDPARPDLMDKLTLVFEDFVELHGDRALGDDGAMVTGLCKVGGIKVMLVAQRKGKTTKERMAWNFGSPNPEGYRKAIEKMKLAEKFKLPIVTLVNTPGAYPGIAAEEHGQAFIIAKNLFDMSKLRTPIVSVVIGEGGSGGALGIGVADRVLILENAYYSVISPEACSAILWRDRRHAAEAAEALKLTAQDLLKLDVVDEIVSEPEGGAHRDYEIAATNLGHALRENLARLRELSIDELVRKRYQKFRALGSFAEGKTAMPTT